MSRWLTSVVAKVMKRGKSQSAARPRRRIWLGIESLGGAPSLGGHTMPVRPEVEQLEERRLMSSSGVVSAITDNYGHTTVFEIGGNGQVYELNPAVRSGWFPLVDYNAAGFRQVSAGLDGYGRAICFAIHNGDNEVWEMDNYSTQGFTTESTRLLMQASQISATRHSECFGISGSNISLAVYLQRGWDDEYHLNSPAGYLTQISIGVDRYGGDVVYLLNWAQQVYRLDNGTYRLLPMHATQISAGAAQHWWADDDLFYIDTSWANNVYYYNGSSSKLVGNYAAQISAGLDQYGNEVVYSIDMYYHGLRRNDLSGNLNGEYEGGNVAQISAAGNDLVFAVCPDQTLQVFDRDWAWGVQWTNTCNWGWNGWHFISSWTANPYYAPLAA